MLLCRHERPASVLGATLPLCWVGLQLLSGSISRLNSPKQGHPWTCLLELRDLWFELLGKLPLSGDKAKSSSGPVFVKESEKRKGQGRKCQAGDALESLEVMLSLCWDISLWLFSLLSSLCAGPRSMPCRGRQLGQHARFLQWPPLCRVWAELPTSPILGPSVRVPEALFPLKVKHLEKNK